MNSMHSRSALLARAKELSQRSFRTNRGQVGRIVDEFAQYEVEHLGEHDDQDTFEQRMDVNIGLLEDVLHSLNPIWNFGVEEEQKAEIQAKLAKLGASAETTVWPFPDAARAHFNKHDAHHDWPHDQISLLSHIGDYMDRAWGKSPTLERILIGAALYSEANAFSQSLRGRLYGFVGLRPKPVDSTLTWQMIRLWGRSFVSFVAGAAIGALVGDRYGLGAGLWAFAIYMFTSGLFRTYRHSFKIAHDVKQNQLLDGMFAVVKAASEPNVAPAALRSAMESSAAHGAVWPAEVWQLVLRAEDRCRWKV